jgi:glycosyltransferase involved in cell wall biosynthesis
MNLLQITVSKVWRGHEQKIIYLYEAFEDNPGIDNQYILCANDTPIQAIAVEKKMKVTGLDVPSEYNIKVARQISEFIKKHNIDIVFIHSSKAHTLAVISHLFFKHSAQLVLCRTLIKRVDTNFFRKWKYNYEGIKKIICVSNPVVDVLKFAVKDHSRMCVVGSVTDVKKFKKTKKDGLLHNEFNIPKDHKLIGNIAEFTGFKDHYTWVDTVEELVKRNRFKATFILVGKGGLEADIRNYVREKNLETHIIFTGFRKDIPDVLPEFDLFMFTSNNEPTGGVLLEAYACRIPIVAANAGGIPEVIIDNETGLLAEVGNPTDFADKVDYLISQPKLQNKFTENGYQYLIDNFTKDVIAEKMFKELSKVHEN